MPNTQVVPFTTDHLDAAAELLAASQRRLRSERPELPEAYTDPAACRPLIAAILEGPGAYGSFALLDGEPAGYLIGQPKTEPIWGRACWSPIEGAALADGIEPEYVRDLYADWADNFRLRGYFRQYVHAPVDDSGLMAAWVRTGFGQMQAHAIRDLELHAQPPAGVTIRRAVPDDIDAMAPLLPLIALALVRPPAFAIRLPGEVETYRDSWLEELSEPAARHLLAEENGRILALATFYDAEPGPMVPDGAWELAVAMTDPEERGRGLMRALLAAAFEEARRAGARHCVTDWRTASLPTHRSWTALGFRPSHYRLHRHIDERIAWAGNPG